MPDPFFQIRSEQSVTVIELTLPAALDTEEFDRLNAEMATTLDGNLHGQWILDLSSVSYMGSAILGLLVNLRQQIKSADGKLILCGLSPRLLEVFHACSLERLFTIARSRAEAMRLVEK
ncbi:MAG TPA: STAS domain-containing protein [Tepidisphaeraceae bacterium]|jgi:anti-anti-sigma factor